MKYIHSNGGKWVYYDWTTGKMAHGEAFVNYDSSHTGWYLFDQYTGAMFHGDTYIRSNGGKWVRYDRITGKMVKGLHYQDTGGKNIRGQYCKKSEHGQQKNDADGTPIICECCNGNKVPHWYAK